MLDVLKLDKSKDVKLLQSQNIYIMFVTLDVSKLDTFKDVKLLQFLNIAPIRSFHLQKNYYVL